MANSITRILPTLMLTMCIGLRLKTANVPKEESDAIMSDVRHLREVAYARGRQDGFREAAEKFSGNSGDTQAPSGYNSGR